MGKMFSKIKVQAKQRAQVELKREELQELIHDLYGRIKHTAVTNYIIACSLSCYAPDSMEYLKEKHYLNEQQNHLTTLITQYENYIHEFKEVDKQCPCMLNTSYLDSHLIVRIAIRTYLGR